MMLTTRILYYYYIHNRIMEMMLCSKLHYQIFFTVKFFSYEMARTDLEIQADTPQDLNISQTTTLSLASAAQRLMQDMG